LNGVYPDNQLIEKVLRERNVKLEDVNISNIANHPEIKNSRLLVCNSAASDASEASEIETNGFFNSWDIPPWDTWIAVFPDLDRESRLPWEGYLISLVPSSLISLVQAGIDVNPCEVLYWANPIFHSDEFLNRDIYSKLPNWLPQWKLTSES